MRVKSQRSLQSVRSLITPVTKLIRHSYSCPWVSSRFSASKPALAMSEVFDREACMTISSPSSQALAVWTTEPVSTSYQRTSKSVPKRGITPMREPCSGSKSNAGPPAIARSISRVIGKSRNREYFSVTAKSCIKTGFFIVIGVVWTNSPSALITE